MGDFPAADLRRPDGLYPHHAHARCAGCGEPIKDDDRAYSDWDHIWHSGCWPRTDAAKSREGC